MVYNMTPALPASVSFFFKIRKVNFAAIYIKMCIRDRVRRVKIDDTQAEISRFRAAKDQATEELKALYDKAVKEAVSYTHLRIFIIYEVILLHERKTLARCDRNVTSGWF